MTQPAPDQIAPVSRRAVAYIIDALIAGGLAIVLGGGLLVAVPLAGSVEGGLGILMIGGPLVSLVLLGWFFVYTVMQAGGGSIGMRAQGLRLVSATDGSPLGFGRTLLRNVIFGLAASVVVGYFTPLFDGSGRFQGWHDKVAGALMLDARVSGPLESTAVAPAAVPASAVPAGRSTPTAAPAIPGIPQPVAAPAPAAPAPVPVAAPTPASAPIPPRPAAPAAPVADAGSLIAFVPGITQDAPVRPAPAAEPALDATIQHQGAGDLVVPPLKP
ncbi:RDD family protein, partial [Microbacterium sp. MYb24]|uniref:RDD family protein n=3 Tax=Microbacterium TaxID=33882 RepID=UPI000D4B0905